MFSLPIVEVVAGGDVEKEAYTDCAAGVMVNSGFLTGMTVEEAKKAITQWLEQEGKGHAQVNFKLRDWVFSRQRYWGEPIPMVHCEACGWQPLPEQSCPWCCPRSPTLSPARTGKAPGPPCGVGKHHLPVLRWPGKARNRHHAPVGGLQLVLFALYGPPPRHSSVSREAVEYWGPVDWYNGGMEHTTLHLLYSRFWHKFLYDIGLVPTAEPYKSARPRDDPGAEPPCL